MIKIKPRPAAPNVLNDLKVVAVCSAIQIKASSGSKPDSIDFPPLWIPDARKTLWEHQNHKCCYCEREREEKRESDLEHFRPKARVQEEATHFGYWWLAYRWENYLFSCKPCNQGHKKNQFPLLPSGTRAFLETDSLMKENPVLINPFDEDPECLISFDWEDSNGFFVKAVSTANDVDERGKKTIEIVGLNRPGLPEERASFLLTLEAIAAKMHAGRYFDKQNLIDQAETDIKRETSSSKQFTGFRRSYFRKLGLGKYISAD
jgi:uncharacterized protein (TIGR02646 family)